MTTLERALQDLDEIVRTLEASIDQERHKPDVAALARWAVERGEVRARLAALERSVLSAVEEEARRSGREPTLDALSATSPDAVDAIRSKIGRVRALVRDLTASDARRHAMVARARAVVRAYLAALFPAPQAYGRGGEARAASLPSSTRTQA